MTNVDHAEEAAGILAVIDPRHEGAAEFYAAAQVHATLALAAEQRTTNLLLAATATYPNGSGMFSAVSDGLHAEILGRMGIEL